MLLPHVLNSTWSAECAELASIVIELVIGILLSLQTITCLLFSITNYISCCEMKLQLQITLKTCNHYVVITLGFSINTTLIYSVVSDTQKVRKRKLFQ